MYIHIAYECCLVSRKNRSNTRVVSVYNVFEPIPWYPENVMKGVLDEPSTKCRYRIA